MCEIGSRVPKRGEIIQVGDFLFWYLLHYLLLWSINLFYTNTYTDERKYRKLILNVLVRVSSFTFLSVVYSAEKSIKVFAKRH